MPTAENAEYEALEFERQPAFPVELLQVQST
jgi:hypothetical protein